MENGKQEAFGFAARLDGENIYSAGLTKREYFAAMAMQGYIVRSRCHDDTFERKVAEWSVKMADALLKALETKSE